MTRKHRTIRPATALGLLALSGVALSAETFSADVWADNWFEMRIDGERVAEDSVPITTERSFNAESFAFEAERPFVVGLVARDFKENDTGLEYIGTRRQQMGDGGVIVQIADADGGTVAASDASWRCLVVHTAPLDTACEGEANPIAGQGPCGFETRAEPEGWDAPGFDDSDWQAATVHTAREVSPKDGYDRIDWVDGAELVWGSDLERDNTVLCRVTVE